MTNKLLRATGLGGALVAISVLMGCATTETEMKPAPVATPAAASAPKPAPAPAPMTTPVPAPAPTAAPMAKPAPKPAVLKSVVLMEFNKSNLDELDRFRLDRDIVEKLSGIGAVKFATVSGHADRLGSASFNQKLSEKRADTVKKYLVSKGMDASKIETFGFGKTNPQANCPDQKDRKALILCLEPNRRVEVEVTGSPR
jgi:OmpA-OmpF porin, OOP family